MLAPLVVHLLISCTLILLAGWTYDLVEKWAGASRRVVCCTESSSMVLRKRINGVERLLLSDSEALGYTQETRTARRHRHTRHPA